MTDKPVFERLAVIGMGLIGGSVALGALHRGIAAEVMGVDPDLEDAGPIRLAPLREAAAWADAVVLAVPVSALDAVLSQLARVIGPRVVVTDTASVKVPVAEAVRRLLPSPERCVGAHPMAGAEVRGFRHARPDLFEGAACILTPAGGEPPSLVDRVDEFWQCFGTFTVRKTPDEHDAITAALSHAPHVIAYAFAQGLPGGDALRLAGRGLRDFIRIARANPELWTEILLMNRSHVTEEVARFQGNLDRVLEALARGDRQELVRALRSGQAATEPLER